MEGRKVACFMAVFILGCSFASAVSDWPTFKQNNERTGFQAGRSNYSLSDITLLWNYSTKGVVKSSPAVADLDGDGKLEVVFGSDDGVFYALDYHGRELWNYSVGRRIRSSPTVADLNLDRRSEVVFGADDGVVYVLDSSGGLVWNYTTNGSVSTSPLVGDLDGGEGKEVLVTSEDGSVYAFDQGGEFKWSYKTGGPLKSSPAAGDVNGDGKKEVVFGSDDSILYVLSFPPYKVWQYQTDGEVAVTPAISDYDGDGKAEAILASTDAVVRPVYWGTALSTAGKKKVCKVVLWKEVCEFVTPAYSKLFEDWNASVGGEVYSSPSVADFSGKSQKDIVFGADDHSLYMLDASGKRVGGYTTNRDVKSTPALSDLNGDGIPEVIFGSDDGGVYVVDYPYLFSLSYMQGARESSRSLYEGLMKMGGDAIALAEKLGENATIKTGEGGLWEIVKTVGLREEKIGSITLKEALGKLEVQVVAQRTQFDARKTGTLVRAYSYPNRQKYRYQTLGPVRSSPAVADLNNDSHLEFTVASDDGVVYAFGNRRQFIKSEANEYLALAEKMYSLGKRSETMEYVSKAIELHGEANDSSGLSQDNALVKRLEADDILLKAQESYNESLVSNASDYLTNAALIYASINYTKQGLEVERLSDLLEAELYYREASALYKMGDLDNASKYALKAAELFFFYNKSESLQKTRFLYELAKERSEADAHYVTAMNMFFTEGYSDNVTGELSKARDIYEDINASESIAMMEGLVYRINATKLTDDAYMLYGKGNISGAHTLASEASILFRSINYTPGLYRAETMLNNSADYMSAEDLFDNAKRFYSKGDIASAIDYAQKAEGAYAKYNASERLTEVGSFINKSRIEYKTKVKRPRYLIILFNMMVGVFSGGMLILSVEKLVRDRKKAQEKRDPEEQIKSNQIKSD